MKDIHGLFIYLFIMMIVFCMTLLFIKGCEDTFCNNFNHEVELCSADNWHSDHCEKIRKQQEKNTCE